MGDAGGVDSLGYGAFASSPATTRARSSVQCRLLTGVTPRTIRGSLYCVVALLKVKVSGRVSTGFVDAVGDVVIWLRCVGAGAGGFAPAG